MNTQNKKNILFHAINGIGFWHIQRAKNIACFFKNQHFIWELHLASSSQWEFDMGEFTHFHHLSEHISIENYAHYERKTYREILDLVIKNNIQAIFHDTHFISPLVKNRIIHHFLIYRSTSLEHFQSVKNHADFFSCIYIPHSQQEFETIIPLEEYIDIKDKIVFLWYIVDQSLFQLYRERKSDKKSKTIVISPGFWWDYHQVKDFFQYSISVLKDFLQKSKEKYEIQAYLWIHREKICEELDIPKNYQIQGFSSLYKTDFVNADIFIGRGGYNTVTEIITLWKRALLYFAHRHHESQEERIGFFEENYPFIFAGTKNKKKDVGKLLLLEKRKKLHSPLKVMKDTKPFIDIIQRFIDKPKLCIFHSSYIQDSQTFVADEINELSRYFEIFIITFNKDFSKKSLYNPYIRVIYFKFANILYTYRKYPYVHLYNWEEKKIYAYFLKFISQFLLKNNISYLLWAFLSDTLFIADIKKIHKNVKLFSYARGRDIYHEYKQAKAKQQQQLQSSIDALFVMDNYMKDFTLSEGFKEEHTHIIYSWKYIDLYPFCYRNFSQLRILIWWRFVDKKWILETLDFLEELLKRWKVSIDTIILVWEESVIDKKYSSKVFKKISESPLLSQKVEYRWFLWKHEFSTLLKIEVNIFIWHFQRSQDGDEDGIPNIIIENMLMGSMIFSTLSWWIDEILLENKTGYILSRNIYKDIEKFETIFLTHSRKDLNTICETARKNIERKCDIKKQMIRVRDIIREK